MPKASSKRVVNEKKSKIPVEAVNVEQETEQVNGDVNLNATYNVPMETNLKESSAVEKEMDKDNKVPEEKLSDIDEPIEEDVVVAENGVTSTIDNDDEEKAPEIKSKKATKKVKSVPTENGNTSPPKKADKVKSDDIPPTKRGRPTRMASSKDKAAPKKTKAKTVPESEQEDDVKMENEINGSGKAVKGSAKKNSQETKKKPAKAKELVKQSDENEAEELEIDENYAESNDKPKAEPKKRGRKPKESSKAIEENVVEKPIKKTKTSSRKKAN